MKKVVIFTEGRSELIFIRELLIRTIANNDLSFDCIELKAGKRLLFPYKQNSPTAKIHFLIVNVGNDERVLSEINNRGSNYTIQGMEIIGIRDMYSETYENYSHQIDQNVIGMICQSHEDIIKKMCHSEMIHFFFAIMELEAWFLAMYRIFERIDPLLTTENIKNRLNYDLENNDPEKTYFHPAVQVGQILQLAGRDYDKHQSDVSSIVSHINVADIQNVIYNNFCRCFVQLNTEIQREYLESQNTEGVEISILRTKANQKMPFRLEKWFNQHIYNIIMTSIWTFSTLCSGITDFSPLAKRLMLTVF
jgi:hypothetical protein